MKGILSVLLLFTVFIAEGQYFEKVRKAELHFVRNEVSEASAIYNQLYEKDRKALLSQDCLNAAYCEMEVSGFLGAQRFLNLLALRYVPFEVLEESGGFRDLVNQTTWGNYKNVYNQLYLSASPNNDYTIFQEEFSKGFRRCNNLLNEMLFLPVAAISYQGEDTISVIIHDGKVRYTVTSGLKADIVKKGQNLVDSLLNDKLYSTRKFEYDEACDSLYHLYKEFFSSHDWPNELELGETLPFSRGSELLQFVGFCVSLEDPFKFSVDQTSVSFVNSIYSDEMREVILKPIKKAIELEKIKPIHVFRAVYPSLFRKVHGKDFLTIFVEEKDCIYDKKDFLKTIDDDFDFETYASKFNLESRDAILEKYIWSHQSEKPFSLNAHVQRELSIFPSCESAKEYVNNNKLIQVPALP